MGTLPGDGVAVVLLLPGYIALWDWSEFSWPNKQVDASNRHANGDGCKHEVEMNIILELVIDPSGGPDRHRVAPSISSLKKEL